jgi:hypothetical protein
MGRRVGFQVGSCSSAGQTYRIHDKFGSDAVSRTKHKQRTGGVTETQKVVTHRESNCSKLIQKNPGAQRPCVGFPNHPRRFDPAGATRSKPGISG